MLVYQTKGPTGKKRRLMMTSEQVVRMTSQDARKSVCDGRTVQTS